MNAQDDYAETIRLNIEGLDQSGNVDLIEKKMNSLAGVESIEMGANSETIEISYDPSRTSAQDIIR